MDNTCCPTDSGCKMAVKSDPHCANNQTWDLYYHEGWFCCMHGTIGYLNSGLYVGNTKTTGVACAEHWMHGEEYDVLVATAKGKWPSLNNVWVSFFLRKYMFTAGNRKEI